MWPANLFSGKIKINLSKFCQARVNIWLFKFLPFWLSRWYLLLVGKLYYALKRQEKRLIQATIRHTFGEDLAPRSLNKLIRRAFKGIIDHYHEKLFVAYSNFPRLLKFLRHRLKLAGEAELQELVSQGKGVILVTGHYGAVEFLPGALAVRGYPVTMICRFQTNRLRESLKERAEAVGLQLVDAEEGNVLLAAIKALKSGRIVITECDEFDEWRPGQGHEVTFLKSRLAGDRTLETLRKRSGAALMLGLVQRQGRKRYTLNCLPVSNGVDNATTPAQACLKALEAAIQTSPAQWYQWKKFGQMLGLKPEASRDHQASGYLAPQLEFSVSL